jgi:hypothetical protein
MNTAYKHCLRCDITRKHTKVRSMVMSSFQAEVFYVSNTAIYFTHRETEG